MKPMLQHDYDASMGTPEAYKGSRVLVEKQHKVVFRGGAADTIDRLTYLSVFWDILNHEAPVHSYSAFTS